MLDSLSMLCMPSSTTATPSTVKCQSETNTSWRASTSAPRFSEDLVGATEYNLGVPDRPDILVGFLDDDGVSRRCFKECSVSCIASKEGEIGECKRVKVMGEVESEGEGGLYQTDRLDL